MRLAAAWLAALLALTPAAGAQPQQVSGEPELAAPLVDPDFGVSVNALGLRREVEMFQWQRDGDSLVGTWSARRVDDSEFPPGHANPPEPAYGSRTWLAGDAQLQGRVLDQALLDTLDGWERLPSAEAASALPPNLAVVFQPAGGFLGSGANPDVPEVGDLRLRWWQLPPGPMYARVVVEEGRWVAAEPGGGLVRGDAPGVEDGLIPADGIPGLPARDEGRGGFPLLGYFLIAFLLVGGVVLIRRRHARR